jgi:hypothetical protein
MPAPEIGLIFYFTIGTHRIYFVKFQWPLRGLGERAA